MGAHLRTAAVVYGPGDDVDAALSAAMAELVLAGVTIGGLLQRFGKQVAPGKREMLLDVLPDGETIRLNDPRGPGVQGCILDTDALTRAAMAFHDAIVTHPDLLLASRFGKEEVAGHGLRAELAEAMLAGIPLLIPVRVNLLPDWVAFLGAPGEVLAPTAEAILGWAASKHIGAPVRPAVAIGW
jgi:molybdate transport system ATP-binding protein